MPALDPEHLVSLLEPFDSATRVWVAFSGGLDSSVLLTAASEVRDALPGRLHAVHVDHGLHPRSPRWAECCAAFCRDRSVPLVTECLTLAPRPGESLEALAREARYALFARLLGRGDVLLTAHHEDDQAETLLLALLRGSGVRGLSAMPVAARLGRGHLVRPLLVYRRSELECFARDRRLDWIEDPSNAQTALDRNYLRHQILPLLRTRWPAVSTTLSRSARHCAEAAGLVEGLARETLPQLFGERPGTLAISLLEQLDRALQKAVLRLWLGQLGFALPDARHLERVLDEVVSARADANPLVAWAGCEIRRYRDDLFCLQPLPEPPARTLSLGWSIGREPTVLELPDGLGMLEWRPDETASPVDAAGQASARLDVRFGQTGWRCRSASGHRRSLKDCFQAAGVPSWARPYVPMIFCGGELVAIAGVCGCEPVSGIGLFGTLVWRGARQAWIESVLRREVRLKEGGLRSRRLG